MDREWSGAIAARVISGSISQWHSMARCEDRIAGYGRGCNRGERKRVDKPDDIEFGDAGVRVE